MKEPRVQLEALTKCYGRITAIRDVDLTLRPGECVGLVGHNGAGKSTIIKLILGLIRPTVGSVSIFGTDPSAHGAASIRRKIGYLPENLSLYPSMTGVETLAFYARLKGVSERQNGGLLDQVGLNDAANRRVQTYSKGMRQRLGLAQALLGAPELLLLDEPTTGLDPALRLTFYDVIRRLRDEGATILISSHALAELQEQTDRVVIMNHGRKVADGSIADLRRLTQRPVRIRLILADEGPEQPLPVLPANSNAKLDWHRISPSVVEAQCAESDKMRIIELLAASRGRFKDIDIISSSLDETYAHFLRREAAE